MSKTYTIEISDLDDKVFKWGEVDPNNWLQTVVKHRASKAIEEIYRDEIKKAIENPNKSEISSNKKEVVLQSNILSAKERHEQQMIESQEVLK